ncbi:MAG: hypothetical protein KAH57_01725 [Thermoplasmata archaeon]|nr:hypothetical protein [Thermoplasmata archaeon]
MGMAMSEKVVTISARVSRKHVDIMDRFKDDLDLTKTDVIQKALELLGTSEAVQGENKMTLSISANTLNRASDLFRMYGQGTSVEDILTRSIDRGVRVLEDDLLERRRRDQERMKVHLQATKGEVELRSTVER